MNRRNILTLLARLPFAGMFVGLPAIAVARTTPNLAEVRDMLLPGLWAEAGNHPDLEFDILVDYETRALIVRGFDPVNNNELGFAITRQAIEDNLYKGQFRPSVLALIRCLRQAKFAPPECFGKVVT